MEERQLAKNIMNVLGNCLVNITDITLGGGEIADRYLEKLAKAKYDIAEYNDCIEAIRHYVISAGYQNGKFVFMLSNYRMC